MSDDLKEQLLKMGVKEAQLSDLRTVLVLRSGDDDRCEHCGREKYTCEHGCPKCQDWESDAVVFCPGCKEEYCDEEDCHKGKKCDGCYRFLCGTCLSNDDTFVECSVCRVNLCPMHHTLCKCERVFCANHRCVECNGVPCAMCKEKTSVDSTIRCSFCREKMQGTVCTACKEKEVMSCNVCAAKMKRVWS